MTFTAKMTSIDTDIADLAEELAQKSPQKILHHALTRFGGEIAISFSGAEDIVLVDMAHKINQNVRVFTLDTGRLHPETYQFFDQIRKHYKVELEVVFPEAKVVEKMVQTKGLFSFYEEGHKECCGIRKVAPLQRKLSSLSAWITGQRQDQSPSTRSTLPIVQIDTAFSTPDHTLIKFNPLANWTSAQVWEYIQAHKVPYNTLHERGFVSIGCEPCTRAVLPYQQEREGRWWWENATDKECGLHAENPAISQRT